MGLTKRELCSKEFIWRRTNSSAESTGELARGIKVSRNKDYYSGRGVLVYKLAILLIVALGHYTLPAQTKPSAPTGASRENTTGSENPSPYVLGPDDQIVISALHVDEVSDKPIRVQPDGNIHLAMIGDVAAAGLTVGELEATLRGRLKEYYIDPEVTVTVAEFHSQPVSIVGAVMSPGVHQLEGHKTLLEMLSMAGGPRPDAGSFVRITRQLRWGRLPLPDAHDGPGGQWSIGEVNLKELLESQIPSENILIRPLDVISVPVSGSVYVIGQVKKPGGFVLGSRPSMSVLEALSLAEGLDPKAAPHNARILRAVGGDQNHRSEEHIDVTKILRGSAPDVQLQSADILLIPDSALKNATLRSLETAIQLGTGITTGLIVWH
jgi:polysaccharide biosynthesis/export protein